MEDGAGRLGPPERFGRVHVVRLNEAADFFSQVARADEDASPEGAPFQLSEPGLDGIELGVCAAGVRGTPAVRVVTRGVMA